MVHEMVLYKHIAGCNIAMLHRCVTHLYSSTWRCNKIRYKRPMQHVIKSYTSISPVLIRPIRVIRALPCNFLSVQIRTIHVIRALSNKYASAPHHQTIGCMIATY